MMITIERRVIVNVDCKIAVKDVERLLGERTEYNALYAMLPSIKVEWEKGGGICTETRMTTPTGQQIMASVIPPRHPSVRREGETDEYYVECCGESGYRLDAGAKLYEGRKRFDRHDCAAIAVALHKIMAEQEANNPL